MNFSHDVWIILTGALAGGACALVGTFLVLRRMSMLGDAISHAVLPGIAIAFLLTGSRSSIPMLLGAALFGVLTSLLVETLHKKGRLQQDAAIGVSFTWLFAIGVILISGFAGAVDLDQDCVLYGEIAYVSLDTISFLGYDLPEAVVTLGGIFLANLLFVVIARKELTITSFDPALATSLGISATLWHYALMGMVSLTTVGAFWSVGAILVVAMLIAPAAAAWLLTDRLSTMLWLAVAISVLSSIGGNFLSRAIDGSIAGGMAVASGVIFALVLFFSPRHGLLGKWRRRGVEGLETPEGIAATAMNDQ